MVVDDPTPGNRPPHSNLLIDWWIRAHSKKSYRKMSGSKCGQKVRRKIAQGLFELARSTDSYCAIRIIVERLGDEILAKRSNGSAAVVHF
jgi:hypothetical protein